MKEGYSLTVAARRPEKLTEAANGLRDAGHEVEEVAGNMVDEEDVQGVVAAHRDRWAGSTCSSTTPAWCAPRRTASCPRSSSSDQEKAL